MRWGGIFVPPLYNAKLYTLILFRNITFLYLACIFFPPVCLTWFRTIRLHKTLAVPVGQMDAGDVR